MEARDGRLSKASSIFKFSILSFQFSSKRGGEPRGAESSRDWGNFEFFLFFLEDGRRRKGMEVDAGQQPQAAKGSLLQAAKRASPELPH